jgi:acyl-coenzyme A synthetase/AMP-(fatty) acid ligase
MPESRALIPLHRLLSQLGNNAEAICHDGERFVSWRHFANVVGAHAEVFARDPARIWLLHETKTYRFACLLFALLHAGKEVVIPPNGQPGTVERLRAQHDFDSIARLQDFRDGSGTPNNAFATLDAQAPALHLYTSGSSGEPKRVSKSLAQFEAEIEVLETMWGARLGKSNVVATVPHHHIYGLLFRVLWPMAAGRCFDTALCTNPDMLIARLHQLGECALVASPAQLSRLPELIALTGLQPAPTIIFSSGGPLASVPAASFAKTFGRAPVEIYGSTETGGIAWRSQDRNTAWTPLPGLQVQRDIDGALLLRSPFLPKNSNGQAWRADDAIELQKDGRFQLRGRLDRIVKIEEKRISLPDMEMQLMRHPYIAAAALTALDGRRRRFLGAAAVLSDAGHEALAQGGRSAVARALRAQLAQYYEAPLLPRRWRFIAQLPLNEGGKLSQRALAALFEPESEVDVATA